MPSAWNVCVDSCEKWNQYQTHIFSAIIIQATLYSILQVDGSLKNQKTLDTD